MMLGCSTAPHVRRLCASTFRTFSENGDVSYWCRSSVGVGMRQPSLTAAGVPRITHPASPSRPAPFNLTRRGQEGSTDDLRARSVRHGPRKARAARLPASPRRLFFRPAPVAGGRVGVSGNGTRQGMDAPAIQRAVVRMAHEVVERNKGPDGLALIGVRSRGVHLAQRLRRALQEVAGGSPIPCGGCDTPLPRDALDRGLQTLRVQRTDIAFPVDGRRILLVDDVLFTGRTVRAAMDALVDFGRPPAAPPPRP